jgi:glycosyltransferase involved in cell wall biosynthesis
MIDGFPSQGSPQGEASLHVLPAPFDDPEALERLEGGVSPGEFLGTLAGEAIMKTPGAAETTGAEDLADHTEQSEGDRLREVYRLTRDPDTYEVTVESDVTLEDYRQKTHPEDWARLTEWAKPFEGKTVAFFNPTMEGGGVAMMRPPLVHLLNQLGVKAHWYVMEPVKDPAEGNPFVFTKQMHNISQRMSDERITEEGKALHWRWADEENGPVLERQEPIRRADTLFFDDPQTAPLIGRLKRASTNPDVKTVWRNHIDTDGRLMADPSTPQGEVASYLLDECGVRGVDAIIAHPVTDFVHRDPELYGKTWFAPATFDHFDNLNRHLSEGEIVEGIEFINAEIAAKNAELAAAGRTADIQPLLSLDPNKQRVTLIARYDPSKRMDKAMEMGVLTRQKMRVMGVPEADLPEVVIVGNGSRDDPDGEWMYEEILRVRREFYPEEADGITVMRLKHNYDAMNALMSRSDVIMQTSDAEGLETRVSDAIKHGKPVVVSNRGGIKTQVVEGESGIVLDYDQPGSDLARGAEFMSYLLTHPGAYEAVVGSTARQAEAFNLREFTTPANAARLLRVFNRLLEDPRPAADKTWLMREMAATGAPNLRLSIEEVTEIAA